MIEIIPAIDIIGGQCVRLTQGDYAQKSVYFNDPTDAAMLYVDAGVRRLHLVDLDGAKASEPSNLAVLERIARRTGLDIQYGGGIKNATSLRRVLDAGASRAIVGSAAVTDPDSFILWLSDFGPSRIILGADTRNGLVATHGWLQESTLSAAQLIGRFTENGLNQAIVTDIARDGMLSGPAFDLYRELQNAFPTVDITASGGISSANDIARLDEQQTRSVIVGKALYENKITLDELKIWL
jgi:phosphoribosylformimino-5-aminoimidazole carboxamide ribotide isomerase